MHREMLYLHFSSCPSEYPGGRDVTATSGARRGVLPLGDLPLPSGDESWLRLPRELVSASLEFLLRKMMKKETTHKNVTLWNYCEDNFSLTTISKLTSG